MPYTSFFDIPLENDPTVLQEKSKIKELLEYDRYCRDNGHFEQMAECYSDDSVVRVSWFNGTGKEYCRRLQQAGGGGAKHKIDYTVVWINGDRAIGEMTTSMLSPRKVVDGLEFDVVSYARIVTRVRREAGAWKIIQGDCIYERDQIVPVIPTSTIPLDAARLEDYRASYKCLCYVQSLEGETSDQELPGEDRPETVEKLYREASEWIFQA